MTVSGVVAKSVPPESADGTLKAIRMGLIWTLSGSSACPASAFHTSLVMRQSWLVLELQPSAVVPSAWKNTFSTWPPTKFLVDPLISPLTRR